MRYVLPICLSLAAPLAAEVPRVVTDIPPVQSLVAQVMAGVGAPDLLLTGDTDPHDVALRPSQAAALEAADLVIWIGPELTPGLAGPIETLARGAPDLRLLSHPQTYRRPIRPHAGTGAGAAVDPHAWLDPGNLGLWLDLVRDNLSDIDPENAEAYARNAETARDMLLREFGPAAGGQGGGGGSEPRRPKVILEHDTLQYLEPVLGIDVVGVISGALSEAPSVQNLTELGVLAPQADCILVEPGPISPVVARLSEAGPTVVEIDPLGITFEPGPLLLTRMLDALGDAVRSCGRER